MRGAAAQVDIGAVGIGIDGKGLRPQGIEHALGDHKGGAVCAVERHCLSLEGTGRQGDQIADIAVAAFGVVDGATDIVSGRKRNFFRIFAVKIFFHFEDEVLFHLLAPAVQQLDAVVPVRVMAGGDHDAAVEDLFGVNHIGHARRGRHMQQIGVRSGSRDSCSKRILKHIRAAASVLADHNVSLVRSAVIPAQKPADLKGILYFKCNICFSAVPIGPEILSHSETPCYFFANLPLPFGSDRYIILSSIYNEIKREIWISSGLFLNLFTLHAS